MEIGDGISAPPGREGPAGGAEKKGQGSSLVGDVQGPGSGVRGVLEEGCTGDSAARGADAQKMHPGTQNPGGGWGSGGLLAPGPPVARGPLTCQQEGASGCGAHPACPPTLSRPSTRVSQLPPPGQLHSWPA